MKKQPKDKKIKLHKETILLLNPELKKAQGGYYSDWSYFPNICQEDASTAC